MEPEKAAELTQNPEEQQDLQDDQVIEQNLETEVTSDIQADPPAKPKVKRERTPAQQAAFKKARAALAEKRAAQKAAREQQPKPARGVSFAAHRDQMQWWHTPLLALLLHACCCFPAAHAGFTYTNTSCARSASAECTVCANCCVGIPLAEDCEYCVGLNCEPTEDWGELLYHLLAFVRGHMEQVFTALAAVPIAGRLSDFSIGAMRRWCCPRRKVVVMSCPEKSTLKPDGSGPYDQHVMDKVGQLQQRGRLKMGFDRAGTSTQHPEDHDVDWSVPEQIARSRWMYGFKTAAKKVLAVESQHFDGIVLCVCIKGGPITDVEHMEMSSIIADAKKDAEKSGVTCRIERKDMSYAAFLHEYDEGWGWRLLCCCCPRCIRGFVNCESRCCAPSSGVAPAASESPAALSEELLSGGSDPSAVLSRPASPEQEQDDVGYHVGQRLWCRRNDIGHVADPCWSSGVVIEISEPSRPLVRQTEGFGDDRKWSTALVNQVPRYFSDYSAVKPPPPGFTFDNAIGCTEDAYFWESTWDLARAMNGQSQRAAVVKAVCKLLGWHWLQPALYCALLALNWPEIDKAQKVFGTCVAVREALYFLSTCLCMWTNPAFLLVDIGATVRSDKTYSSLPVLSGYRFLLMYVVAPEKFVSLAYFGWQPKRYMCYGSILYSMICVLLDLCSVGALAAGLTSGSLPPGLAIGYVATAIAVLSPFAALAEVFCCWINGC